MRSTRISHPLPDGKGIFVSAAAVARSRSTSKTRFRLIGLLVALVGLVASPVRASNVSVTLHIDYGTYGAGLMETDCPVSVPEGADGIAVLDAAKALDCIESYQLTAYGNGHFVRCIDDMCGQPEQPEGWAILLFWAMSKNGHPTSYGVDDFTPAGGDELGFTYATAADLVVSCLPPADCLSPA